MKLPEKDLRIFISQKIQFDTNKETNRDLKFNLIHKSWT